MRNKRVKWKPINIYKTWRKTSSHLECKLAIQGSWQAERSFGIARWIQEIFADYYTTGGEYGLKKTAVLINKLLQRIVNKEVIRVRNRKSNGPEARWIDGWVGLWWSMQQSFSRRSMTKTVKYVECIEYACCERMEFQAIKCVMLSEVYRLFDFTFQLNSFIYSKGP